MKFVVSSSEMSTCLQSASKVIIGKSVMPILDNILLEAKNDELYATASDVETTIIVKIELESLEEDGKITIPTKLLLDFLRECPEQPLHFDINTDTATVKITSENGEYSIVGAKAEDYPEINNMDKESNVFMSSCGLILDGILKTDFAMANDVHRPQMNSILFEMNEDNLSFVSSDAHKLVRYKRFDSQNEIGTYSFMLPRKPATLLKNILPKDDTELKLSFNAKSACVEFGAYKMICTLIEGKFPNYESVIPKNNPKKVIVNRRDLTNALRRVSILANQASKLVKFELSGGNIVLSAQDFDYSMSGHESIRCQYDGDPIVIGFKSSFLLEIISNIDTEDVAIELSESTRPGLFLPYESENKNSDLLMLLMPMMV